MKQFIKSHIEIISSIPAIIAFLTFIYSMMKFGSTILSPTSYTDEAQRLIQVSGITMFISLGLIFVAIGCSKLLVNLIEIKYIENNK